MTAEELLIDALSQSEAELRAMVDDLLHDIEIRDEMISVLLEQLQLATVTKSYRHEVRR